MGSLNYSTSAGDAYHKVRHSEIFGNKPLIDAWGQYALETYFRDVPRGSKVLEIGAGTGINIGIANTHFDLWAVEPSDHARAHCGEIGIRAFKSVDELPVKSFDRILLRHVLEHVEEPAEMLRSILPLLGQHGRLILVLPVETPFKRVNPDDIDHHLYCWNRQTASNLLTSTGYSVVTDRLNWFDGRRILLPVLNHFGSRAYAKAMTVTGILRGKSEIVIEATPGPSS